MKNCVVDSFPRLHSLSVLCPGSYRFRVTAVVEITDDIIAKFSQDSEPPRVFQ